MNFPFNFIPPHFPSFFEGNNQPPPQNDFPFFGNPFSQPFFNNPNPFFQNPFNNSGNRDSPRKTAETTKNNDDFGKDLRKNPAEILKEQGNVKFKEGNYPEAVKLYTKAIEKDGTQATYYLNRALCFKYLKYFNETLKDCGVAIELDERNYKAHLLMGRTLAEIGKMDQNTIRIDKALHKIKKAMDLYNLEQSKSEKIWREINMYLKRAQKLLWYKCKELSKAQNCDIYNYMKDALKKEESFSQDHKNIVMRNLESIIPNPFKLNENNYIVPDEYCCKITLDLMDEPLLCPSGVSYEKKILIEHLKTHDFDPVTRFF